MNNIDIIIGENNVYYNHHVFVNVMLIIYTCEDVLCSRSQVHRTSLQGKKRSMCNVNLTKLSPFQDFMTVSGNILSQT